MVAFCLAQSKIITMCCYNKIGAPIARFVDRLLCVPFDFYWIPQAIFLIILLSNAIYIYKNIKEYHDPILSGIFGDDIL